MSGSVSALLASLSSSATVATEAVVELVVSTAVKGGVRVFVSSTLAEKLGPLLRELGFELVEHTGNLPENCVVIREAQQAGPGRVVIEVREGGQVKWETSLTLTRLVKILRAYAEKLRRATRAEYYEVVPRRPATGDEAPASRNEGSEGAEEEG